MIRKEDVYFWDNDPSVHLEVYLPGSEGENRPAIIVLPGGAYFATGTIEGGQVAKYFAKKGCVAFVLRYSTLHPSFEEPYTPKNPHTRFPEPLHEVAAAIKYVRANADELGADPGSISLVGFSAGGHLAANYGNEWNTSAVYEAVDAMPEDIRPNACVLCYAATRLRSSSATMNLAVFGERDDYPDELLRRWCAAGHINRNTPPTFLWHTVTDSMVPVSQSYAMSEALMEEGIPHELHVFSEGDHATGLAEGLPAEPWKELALDFIKRYT